MGAAAASIGYAIPQLLQVAGALPDPLDRILIFAPSLALAPFFVLAVAASCVASTAKDRALRLGAFGMAMLYAGFVSTVYITQLGVVLPREMTGSLAGYGIFACCGFRQPMTVLDLLGYTYMSLATLLLAPTYRGFLRWSLFANGLFAPILFLQLFWPSLIWAASPWLIVFPAVMLLLAREFAAETADTDLA